MSASADVIASSNQTQVHPHELTTVFRQLQPSIKVLSLDCFDTLLWRRTATPSDVFYDLARHPLFLQHEITASMRMTAEHHTYQLNQVKHQHQQARLDEIYRTLKPNVNEEIISELVTTELEYEKKACYAFAPIVSLIQEAAQAGCTIIIVSDIYFTENQLRELLQSCLSEEVFALINQVFCSCDFRTSKTDRLFSHVIKKLNTPAKTIMHVGDNSMADALSPRKQGIHAFHFIQHNPAIAEIIRLQSVAANFFDTQLRNQKGSLNFFGGLLSDKLSQLTPAKMIGYAVLGPILYSFACFIHDRYQALLQEGKKPKIFFLMRDGYLPALAFSELYPKISHQHVRISRFAAIASSFRSTEDIEHYLAQNLQSGRFEDICTQLLLPVESRKKILASVKKSPQPMRDFQQFIKSTSITKTILTRSTHYRERFTTYLKNHLHIEAGDTLLFVDLGYQGTAQIKLTPVLRDEMNVDIVGVYLLALPSFSSTSRHQGLLDFRQCDERAVTMLVTYIAVFEQLCTLPDRSVTDYSENGDPIYSDSKIDASQFEKIKPVHQACVDFIRDARAHLSFTHTHLTESQLRDIASTSLSRFIFLPTEPEIHYLSSFKHDVNLGTKEVISLFDIQAGLENLRKRSWLFSLKEPSQSMRMNYPVELRAANVELSFMLMSQHRFGLELAANDLSMRRENINISMYVNEQFSQLTLDSHITHDGYFSLIVPTIKHNEIAIHFGAVYRWVEIDSAELIALNHLYSKNEKNHTYDASNHLTTYDMNDQGGGLIESTSAQGVMIFVPPKNTAQTEYVLRIIFRPIVRRSSTAQM